MVWEVLKVYWKVKKDVLSRFEEFKLVGLDEKRIFAELVFCLLTPQSKAEICWNAVQNLKAKGVLFKGSVDDVLKELKGVRFKKRKAEYVVNVRSKFDDVLSILRESDNKEIREWLVRNIKGLGYKEASHFLRNIGLGKDLAILDRHILRGLLSLGVIKSIPKNMTKKRYLDIEKRMKEFASRIGIPMEHLDLVLWYMKTGNIFK